MKSEEILHIRPRFQLKVNTTTEAAIDAIRAAINRSPDHISGRVTGGHVSLDIVGDHQHFWSPHVDLRVEPADEHGQSIVSGLIGPRPAVWTMFVFFYFGMAMIGFVISSYGVSKWMMSEFSHFIWAFPIALVFMGTAYWASKAGEKLGEDQTEELKDVIRDALKDMII